MKTESQQQSIWQNRDFVVYFIGQAISNFGNALSIIILPLLVLELTGSAFQVTVVSALGFIPYAVLGLVVGVYLDHANRKWVMQVADFIRFLTLGSIPVVFWAGELNIFYLYVVALINGIAFVFHSIAEVSILPNLVIKEHLTQANSYVYAASNVMRIIGPSLASVLYVYIGYAYSIGIDALTFLLSFVSFLLIKARLQTERVTEASKHNLLQESKEGLRYLWNYQAIRVMLIIITATNLISAPFFIYTLLYVKETLRVDPEFLGLVFGLATLGGLFGSISTNWLKNRFGFGKLIFACLAIDVLVRVLYPFSANVYILCLLLGIVYAMQAIINVGIITLRQTSVPDHLLGRVNGVFRTIVFAAQPVGLLIGGWVVTNWGAGGALTLLSVLYIFVFFYASINKMYSFT